MEKDQWLRLTDYATKHQISVSTLRRRIKTGEIKYRFADGKYLIHDSATPLMSEPMSPLSSFARQMTETATEAAPFMREMQERLNQLRGSTGQANEGKMGSQIVDEPIFASANRLVGELKKAYMNVLQEKEEQIIQLKEEVTDLKTLVRVLEVDNDRLRRYLEFYQENQLQLTTP